MFMFKCHIFYLNYVADNLRVPIKLHTSKALPISNAYSFLLTIVALNGTEILDRGKYSADLLPK